MQTRAPDPSIAIRAKLLEEGGPELWDEFMAELREQHLGIPRPTGSESVLARLGASYEAELAPSALDLRELQASRSPRGS